MSRKLNSYSVPDSLLKKMKESVDQSRKKDVEIGFNLCEENCQLHDEKYCIGSQCSVDVPKGCSKGKHVGMFHTHSNTSSEPSINDIVGAYIIGMQCIGSTEERSIKCHVRKDKNYTQQGLENIVAALIRFEQPLHLSEYPEEDIENYKKWLKVRREIKTRYLKTIDIG